MDNDRSLQLHMQMGLLMSTAHRAMTRRFVQNSHKFGLDISLDQWIVLGPIWQLKNPSQKDLSEFCLKDKTSITRIVDTLEKKNLVVRISDQLDKRIKRVVLTHEGKELFNHVLPVMEKTREEVREHITDDDIEIFKNVLIQINRNLDEDIG